jgi:hypothetical protein
MNPLLAITAAKLGTNLLNNISGGNQQAKAEAAAKEAAFSRMMAKVASDPQIQNARALESKGITGRDDAESTLNRLAQKILQSPEISQALAGRPEPFELRFLPDGSVAIKNHNGIERTFRLDGDLRNTAVEASAIIEQVKIAFPAGNPTDSPENGGALHITPGAGAHLVA